MKIRTDCLGSCKSYYHKILVMTAPDVSVNIVFTTSGRGAFVGLTLFQKYIHCSKKVMGTATQGQLLVAVFSWC